MADPAGVAGAGAAALAAAADDPEEEEKEAEEEEEVQASGEEEEGTEDDSVDSAAIQGLLADFWGSLEHVFGYSVVVAQANQENLSLIEPGNLSTNWIDNEDLHTACRYNADA
jgi:hypothetical protein